jgi:hypothetical protein
LNIPATVHAHAENAELLALKGLPTTRFLIR